MLQALGLLVHLVPGHAEHVGEEALDQAMAAHDPLGVLGAGGGERDRPVGVAGDVAVALQAPTISWTVGAESCIARATFAPVIGRPASCSQNRICRYSSSATVAVTVSWA